MQKQTFIQYQDKNKKHPHTLRTATRLASELVNKLNCDVYVIGKRIMGEYWIGVMTEREFFPHTRLRKHDKFHDILRIKRFKFEGWYRDPNQGVKQDDK